MLISRLSDGEGRREGQNAEEYQTADELFELMAKDHSYDTNNNQSLSTRDLIILYKNIDVGTKLMSEANVGQHKVSNQHVETIVYKDERESDESDVSDIYSSEDLQNVFSVNNERIDLINNLSSIQHPLCHKFGNIDIQPTNLTSEYDSHFLFKDPYIKQQLRNINILPDSTDFDTILPASLLDYICCKRLEDNYSFYMDNIIKYVQHTIEQLKRISNGDYLTDRAKEKWREAAKDFVNPSSDAAKVLATSHSIPIHVMGKGEGHRSMWDEIVHSEVNIRTLSKLLKKKIIIEVPTLICGSYKLFSERCADNLIISCKKELKSDIKEDKEESQVDVVFQLKPSGSGHVISNIKSIMILQTIPSITAPETSGDVQDEMTLEKYNASFEEHPKIIEIDEQYHKEELTPAVINPSNELSTMEIVLKSSLSDTSSCSLPNNYLPSSSSSIVVDKDGLNKTTSLKILKTETVPPVISPDELRFAVQRPNMPAPVPEESEDISINKKKSPTKIRIKSPYENQSYSIEEKKRRKLLEIRDKREKKKIALSENFKVTKHKFGKGVIMAQPSNSVTKLSITNKSFYNSIYGESANHENPKKPRKSQKKDSIELESSKHEYETGFINSSFTALDRSSFDDGTTETIMQFQQISDVEAYPTPISNYSTDVNLLSQLIGSSSTDYSSDNDSKPVGETKQDEANMQEVHENVKETVDLEMSHNSCIVVPANTPKEQNLQDEVKKITTPIECRKSIDKIYDLLKTLGKPDDEINNSATRIVTNNVEDLKIDGRHSSTIQVTDSGTSVKHHIASSNPSSFSFEKNNNLSRYTKDKKKKEAPAAVVPKVLISTKLQTSKIDSEWNKVDRKRAVHSPPKVSDNPLKAISQLLHEFNNVQKTRHKSHKKDEVFTDGKTVTRQGPSRKTRQEPSIKDPSLGNLKPLSFKDRRSRSGHSPDPVQFSQPLTYGDDKYASRLPRRNLSDLIEEAKEARGEAVRGPSKAYSRINTLAQPKKSYVQAHNDEYQNKYGKNILANRLHRVTTPAPIVEKNITIMNNTRNRRKGPEITSPSTLPKPGISAVPPPLERIITSRRSTSNSPVRKKISQPTREPAFRQITASKSPDLKKKMVAVESYVKSHYGHVPIDTSELKSHEVHKSRVPLVPNDIDLASLSSPNAGESTALGNQLHYMVDTMIKTIVPITLSVLSEGQESVSKLSECLEKLSADSLQKTDERKSESDYPVDIFEDKSILTAVASIPKDKIQEDKVVVENLDTVDTYNVQPFNSATELRIFEDALYQHVSVGSFPKRLRIKNLTLTPKHSLQQAIVVQSGDAGSLLVKSSLSQSLKSDSKTDSLSALKPLVALSNTHINWGFTSIPLQVATIGYAFPTFQSNQSINSLKPRIKRLTQKPSPEDVGKDAFKSHKTSQCFKGVHTDSCLDQATQANIVLTITSNCNLNVNTAGQKEKIKVSDIANKREKNEPITKICERIRLLTEKCQREEGSIIGKYQKLQPIKEKRGKIQTVIEKYEKVHQLTECEKIQSIEEQCYKGIITSSKLSLHIDEQIEDETLRKPSEFIDNCTSLDILMGLLKEIRNITGEAIDRNIDNDEQNEHSKEPEIILKNAPMQDSIHIENNCRDLVSVSSFDKLNRLDSKQSIRSFTLLKNGGRMVMKNENKSIIEIMKSSSIKQENVDKEVTVNIKRQYVNKLTDAPSCFFPIIINHSANINDSVIEIFNKPSTLSVYSLAKYETQNYISSVDNPPEYQYAEDSKAWSERDNPRDTEFFSALDNNTDENISRIQTNNIEVDAMALVSRNVAIGSKFDPLMKMKRDILVTVYSILVFTVFAALSFPKVFFHVDM